VWAQGDPLDTFYGRTGAPWEFGGNGLRRRRNGMTSFAIIFR
jgi:hypothetical protein